MIAVLLALAATQSGGITIDTSTLTLILGSGGVVSAGAAIRALNARRNSAEARESKAVKNLVQFSDDADARTRRCLDSLDAQRDLTSYWSVRAAAREFQLARNGLTPDPYKDPPPPAPLPPVVPSAS